MKHHAEQLKCMLTLIFIAEPLVQNAKREDIGGAAELWHPSEHYVHGLARSLDITKGSEQMVAYNGIHHLARLEDSTEGGEAVVQAAHLAVATDDDAVGV
jgi:hypothetical protein